MLRKTSLYRIHVNTNGEWVLVGEEHQQGRGNTNKGVAPASVFHCLLLHADSSGSRVKARPAFAAPSAGEG